MTGDAKGEYRGLAYRNDAELQAWLEKRPREAALEPDLPIIDPHHHFWDTPQRGRYLLPELLADIGGGHNIVSTIFLECRSMYRKDGPVPEQPFTLETVPLEVRAKARKIPGWTLDRTGLAGRLGPSPVRSDEPVETVALIPMGAARLRVTALVQSTFST